MPNSYYNAGSFPATGSPATSASMRAELSLIAAGFDKLPLLTGNENKLVLVNPGGTGLTTLAAPSGDLVGTTATQTLTNKTISGANNTLSNIANSSLTNSAVTIGSTSIALGGTATSLEGLTNLTASGNGSFGGTLGVAGNLGLGVTPSAWNVAGYKAFEIGALGNALYSGTNDVLLSANAYYNSGWKYGASYSPATLYNQNNGVHIWKTAASGTAGDAISFTQAMTLDASGNLGVGTTSPGARLHVGAGRIFLDQDYQLTWQNAGTNRARIYGDSGNNLVFENGSGNTERARIDSSGNLLVGQTSNSVSNSNSFGFLVNASGAVNFVNHLNGTASGVSYTQYGYNGSVIGYISQNGTTAVAYNTTSDYRLKENIKPMTGALAKIALLKPCTYRWKSDGSAGEGFIAHELAEVVPQCVTGEKDAVDAEGKPVYQGIDTSFLVATLTAALQELYAKVEALEARLASDGPSSGAQA